MKTRLLTLIAILCALLMLSAVCFCACDSAVDNDKDEGKSDKETVETTTVASVETTVDTTTEKAEETTEEQINGYKITVVDENGAPLEGIYVQFCRGDLCMAPYPTEANGVIVYNYDDDNYTVKAIDYNFVYESLEPEYTLAKGEKTLTIVMKKSEG